MLRRAALAFGIVMFLSSGIAWAKKPMGIIDLFGIKTIANARISSDGSLVLFTLSAPDWAQNKNITHIYLADTKSGNYRQMTNGSEGEEQPAWKPDATQFAFLSSRVNKEAQIFLQDPKGGDVAGEQGGLHELRGAEGVLVAAQGHDVAPPHLGDLLQRRTASHMRHPWVGHPRVLGALSGKQRSYPHRPAPPVCGVINGG